MKVRTDTHILPNKPFLWYLESKSYVKTHPHNTEILNKHIINSQFLLPQNEYK